MKADTFETFKEIDGYYKQRMIENEPVCFNGMVKVRKYKVTIELIDEPIEVIHARLQKLWDECKNSHHWKPLKAEAKKYGLKLSHW